MHTSAHSTHSTQHAHSTHGWEDTSERAYRKRRGVATLSAATVLGPWVEFHLT